MPYEKLTEINGILFINFTVFLMCFKCCYSWPVHWFMWVMCLCRCGWMSLGFSKNAHHFYLSSVTSIFVSAMDLTISNNVLECVTSVEFAIGQNNVQTHKGNEILDLTDIQTKAQESWRIIRYFQNKTDEGAQFYSKVAARSLVFWSWHMIEISSDVI